MLFIEIIIPHQHQHQHHSGNLHLLLHHLRPLLFVMVDSLRLTENQKG